MTQPQYMQHTQHQQGSYPPTVLREFDESLRFAADRFKAEKMLKASAKPDITESGARVYEHPTKQTRRGAPRKVRANSLKPYLQGFRAPGYALRVLPQFDHIVTGAVNIDLGDNSRPLSKKLVITLLQRLDEISTEAIQNHMHATLRSCSERNAQRYCQCLRVILNATAKVAETQWPPLGGVSEEDAFSSAKYVTPCGKDTCIICSGSPQQVWGWTHPASSEEAACDTVVDCTEQVENPWHAD